MGIFDTVKEEKTRRFELERQELMTLSEKELLIKILLELKELNKQTKRIKRNQANWSNW